MVLSPPLILRGTMWGVSLATVPQQQSQSQMPSQGCANYAMVPSKMRFLFQSGAYYRFMLVFLMVLFSAFRIQCGHGFHQWRLNYLGLLHHNCLVYTHGSHMHLWCILPGECLVLGLVVLSYYTVNALGLMGSKNRNLRLQ